MRICRNQVIAVHDVVYAHALDGAYALLRRRSRPLFRWAREELIGSTALTGELFETYGSKISLLVPLPVCELHYNF
jgi:hypothetical protein